MVLVVIVVLGTHDSLVPHYFPKNGVTREIKHAEFRCFQICELITTGF